MRLENRDFTTDYNQRSKEWLSIDAKIRAKNAIFEHDNPKFESMREAMAVGRLFDMGMNVLREPLKIVLFDYSKPMALKAPFCTPKIVRDEYNRIDVLRLHFPPCQAPWSGDYDGLRILTKFVAKTGTCEESILGFHILEALLGHSDKLRFRFDEWSAKYSEHWYSTFDKDPPLRSHLSIPKHMFRGIFLLLSRLVKTLGVRVMDDTNRNIKSKRNITILLPRHADGTNPAVGSNFSKTVYAYTCDIFVGSTRLK